jgi:hypothetical protein
MLKCDNWANIRDINGISMVAMPILWFFLLTQTTTCITYILYWNGWNHIMYITTT